MVKPSGQIKEDAKTRILDAADAIFVRHGVDGARMQQIADHAGVNKSLLHYYFRSKAELAEAVWMRIASSFIPGLFQMLASDHSLEEKIDRVVDAYHTLLTRHPYVLSYIVSEASRRPALVDDFYSSERRQATRRMIDKLRTQIDKQVKLKKMAPMSAEQFLVTLLSSCQFPFVARPMMMRVTGLEPAEFMEFMERRRTELPAFLKRALKP
ncbi:MAG TPA: helix-turn-helix domain-containing protein [Bryobacteraceae bacterium]|nr:helix-turn-helix domain-containing protein [Bryobacteraceae bacterium]